MPKVFIIDDLSPEDSAMLQALYSRSSASALDHLEKVRQAGSGKFLNNYVVNYNHKSIADCGSTTLFFEGVSTLAAKAIQDWPLFSGQETSTRYVDMSQAKMVDPANTAASKAVLDRWMEFYLSSLEPVTAKVRLRYPHNEGEDLQVYERAVKARTFDILRGFLPAGICTQTSWHTNLRQAADHLGWMRHHPLEEVRELAEHAISELMQRYPSSGFAHSQAGVSGVDQAALDERFAWQRKVAREEAYPSAAVSLFSHNIWIPDEYLGLLSSRPKGAVLPHFMSDLGQARMCFELDFGSFRDLQRHRNGVCRMPMLRYHDFHPWYLMQLPRDLRTKARSMLRNQRLATLELGLSEVDRQYYWPLGTLVDCQVTYALPALLYVLELRSSKTVHPTLRTVILRIVEKFRAAFPQVALHTDEDPDGWTVRRGKQTIEQKP